MFAIRKVPPDGRRSAKWFRKYLPDNLGKMFSIRLIKIYETIPMNLSKYLPFEQYTIITSLHPEIIAGRLIEILAPKKNNFFFNFNRDTTRPYEGYFAHDMFEINRIINYRNSFLPIITGKISKTGSQTRIDIKMKLHSLVIVFMTIWLGAVGLICVAMLFGSIFFNKVRHTGFSPAILIPFAMFLFGYLLTFLAFKYETNISKKYLENLFEGYVMA
jgi:hypothetical protein